MHFDITRLNTGSVRILAQMCCISYGKQQQYCWELSKLKMKNLKTHIGIPGNGLGYHLGAQLLLPQPCVNFEKKWNFDQNVSFKREILWKSNEDLRFCGVFFQLFLFLRLGLAALLDRFHLTLHWQFQFIMRQPISKKTIIGEKKQIICVHMAKSGTRNVFLMRFWWKTLCLNFFRLRLEL